MTVTAMIVTEMTAIVGIARGHPLAGTMKIVDTALPPKETMMIEGLQGTMITVGGLMTEETLTIIMTVAGMTMTGAEMTEDATRRMNALKTDLNTQTEIVIVKKH